MVKDIKYNGYTSVPADYECPDGDLAGVSNMLPDEYGLIPIFPPTTNLKLDKKYNVVYWHKTNNVNNYIVCFKDVYYYIEVNKIDKDTHVGVLNLIANLSDEGNAYQVNSIGNTLLILTPKGVNYFLWDFTDGYINLGKHIPEIPISFGLQGEMKRSDEFDHKFNNEESMGYESVVYDDWDYEPRQGNLPHLWYWDELKSMKKDFNEISQKRLADTVMAQVNKFIAENTTNAGRFMFPFFVRYAYRLYDGTITMQSAPILMITNSDSPVVTVGNVGVNDSIVYNSSTGAKPARVDHIKNMRVCAMIHQLDYKVVQASVLDTLKKWKDIVKSVDIFISKPIYTYDQNGTTIKRVVLSEEVTNMYSVCKNVGGKDVESKTYYQYNSFANLYAQTFSDDNMSYPKWYLPLPRKEDETVNKDILDQSSFFLLRSIEIEDLKVERTIIDVNKEYLQSLVNREAMTDDYDSHDSIVSKYSYTYNSRLNITGISKKIYSGYHGQATICNCDGRYIYDTRLKRWYKYSTMQFYILYFIKENGRQFVVRGENGVIGRDFPFVYLYHPNPNVYQARIVLLTGSFNYYLDVEMKPHSMLNGSVYFMDWSSNYDKFKSYPDIDHISQSPDEDCVVYIPNKIYSSVTNNPFSFPAENICTVGTGEIYALSSASKALSQGQFGQHPLYAFCSDGVWALGISSTGGFSAVQPFTRDVCIATHSITQLDSSVVFVSVRGIVHISGSNATILTDTLKLEKIFDLTQLPHIEDLAKLSNLDLENIKYAELSKYLPECRIIYAYIPQRLIVYNPNYSYAYVYSIKTKQWGIMYTNIHSHINSYPMALAMTNDDTLVDFCENATVDDKGSPITGIKGIVVTRPIKLDAPDILKTIDTIIQRGTFKRGHVKTALYASNDLFNWQLVWTSQDHYLRQFRGTPYKYFRIVLLCDLEQDESVYGATIQYTPKLTNQPR